MGELRGDREDDCDCSWGRADDEVRGVIHDDVRGHACSWGHVRDVPSSIVPFARALSYATCGLRDCDCSVRRACGHACH